MKFFNIKYFMSYMLTLLIFYPLSGSANCSISVQDILFGSYDAANSEPTMTSAEYYIDCRSPVIVTLEIGPSTNSSDITNRRMKNIQANDTLSYNLYTDPAMTHIWGDGAGSTKEVKKVQGQVYGTIYGKIYPGQDAWVGEYTDTLRITVLP